MAIPDPTNPVGPHSESGSPVAPETTRRHRGARRLTQLVLFATVTWGAIHGLRWATAPKPPAVSLAGLDPAIISVLEPCYDAVRRNPRSGSAWGKLGTALLAYEFKSEAQVCFREAEHREPNDPRWPYFHGLTMFPDATEQGLAKLRRAVKLHGDENSAVRNRLATVLSELGEYEEAETYFRSVLERWPDDPAAILGLGKLAFARGQLEKSLAYLSRSAANRHTAKKSRQLLATVHQRLNNTSAAAQTLREMKGMPDDMPLSDPFINEFSSLRTGRAAWLDYATQLFRQGRVAEATPLVERTIQAYPDSDDAWILLAQIQMRRKEYAVAKKSWDKAIELSPEAVQAHVQLGVTQLYLGQTEAAAACFRRAIELQPNLGEAHHNLGLSYAATDRNENAILAFRNAIRLRPGFVDSYLGLAASFARGGNLVEAQHALDQAEQLSPNDQRSRSLRQRYGLGPPH